MKKTVCFVVALISWVAICSAPAATITFEALALGNPGTDGSTQYGTTGTYYWNGSNGAGNFTTGGAVFANSFINWGGGYTSWDGFAYSNTKDLSTPGYGNQYSSITGGGVFGSDKYAVGYQPYSGNWSISLGGSQSFSGRGVYATNTTYAYLSMRDGDGWVTPFSLAGLDYFDLTITGYLSGGSTGSVTFHLADFRSGPGYIVDSWAWVDLSALGTIDELQFSSSASQGSVPAYVALDNLGAVPEPSSLVLLFLSLALGLFFYARKRFHSH
ncbi:MAG: DUF4465 domain-containing protein [Verrucomicrobiae bacterium]